MRQDGKRYVLRYKVLNNNSISITSKDTAKVKVTIKKAKPSEDRPLYKIARAASRFAMMLRNVGFSYTNSYNMSLPGFSPNVGDFFGQRKGKGNPLAPGVDFAFGLTGESYIDKAAGLMLEATKHFDSLRKDAKEIDKICDQIKEIEHTVDDIYESYMSNLFEFEKDPIELVKKKNIAQALEDTSDVAKAVSSKIRSIVVKNS